MLLDAVTGEVARNTTATLLPDGDGWATCGAFSADGLPREPPTSVTPPVGTAGLFMQDLGAARAGGRRPPASARFRRRHDALRRDVGRGVTTVRIGDLPKGLRGRACRTLACGNACPVAISSNDRHVAVTQAGHPCRSARCHNLTETPRLRRGWPRRSRCSRSPDNRLASAGADERCSSSRRLSIPGGLPVTLIRSRVPAPRWPRWSGSGQRQQSRLYSVGGGGCSSRGTSEPSRAESLEGAAYPAGLRTRASAVASWVLTRDGRETADPDMAARQGRWSGSPFPPEQGGPERVVG